MREFASSIRAAVSLLEDAWDGALPPFGAEREGGVSGLVWQVGDAGLVAMLDAVGELVRLVEGLQAVLAGEVGTRSPAGSRAEGLAFRFGFASPARMVAGSSGGSASRAGMLVSVGRATSTGRSLTGEPVPAAHPHVARELGAGTISVEAAHLMVSMLDRVAPRAGAEACEEAEEALAGHAAEFPLDQLAQLVKRTEALLDPDGVEPTEEVLREGRSLVFKEDRSGQMVLRGVFDPESGAPIRAALEAYVTSALRAARGHNHPDGDTPAAAQKGTAAGPEGLSSDESGAGPVMMETRTVAQIRADALVDMARHVLGCESGPAQLAATTVVVRADLSDLEDRLGGAGFAQIDGIDQPVSAGTVRRLACTAELVPAVMGAASVPLDLGRGSRLFSRAQVLALWERDGGCASCGQTAFVEAHHVRWWERDAGRTDLGNGVLLCSRCHHRVHRDGWIIEVGPGDLAVSFIPPPHIDPRRQPRPGMRRHAPREQSRHQRTYPHST